MGAITGKDFIDRINRLESEIWFDGNKIDGPLSEHPAFKGLMQTKAALYDLQHDPKIKGEMTFLSPETGEPLGLSYLQPKTKDELIKRRKMIEHWARHTGGMMGRSPDYMNTAIMSFASSSAILKDQENCFPENITALYQSARANDLSFSHSFVVPQVNRSQTYFEPSDVEPISAKVIDKNEKGIVVKGARLLATQGGITDEVLVFSTPKFFMDPNEAH